MSSSLFHQRKKRYHSWARIIFGPNFFSYPLIDTYNFCREITNSHFQSHFQYIFSKIWLTNPSNSSCTIKKRQAKVLFKNIPTCHFFLHPEKKSKKYNSKHANCNYWGLTLTRKVMTVEKVSFIKMLNVLIFSFNCHKILPTHKQ